MISHLPLRLAASALTLATLLPTHAARCAAPIPATPGATGSEVVQMRGGALATWAKQPATEDEGRLLR